MYLCVQCWEDVEDVRREVKVMELLKEHPNVIQLVDTLEDDKVMQGSSGRQTGASAAAGSWQ